MRALARIPADRIPLPERLFLRAWFAAQSQRHRTGNASPWNNSSQIDPGNTQGLDRLASLALQAGQLDRAAAFRRRQEEANRDKELYRRLLIEDRRQSPVTNFTSAPAWPSGSAAGSRPGAG